MRALRGIDLLAMREHFSVSFLNTMLSCSMRGVLGSTLRLTPCREQSSPALLKGNIFHKTMEFYFLTLKRKDFTLSSLELFKESMVKAIAHYKKKGKFYKKEVLAAAIQYFEDNVKLAKVMSEFLEKKYYQKARTSDAVIEVEIPFTKVPMFEHLFTGRIDLLFNAEVTDFKTVGQAISKDDPVKYAEKVEKLRADFAMQLLIYDEAMTYLIGNKSKATSTLELILPKSYTILETVVTKNPTVTEYTVYSRRAAAIKRRATNAR